MTKRRTTFLSDYVVNQYPIEKLKEIIFITLDIVETFLLILEDGFDYNSSSIVSYGEKYGSNRYKGSKIESLYIKNIESEETMTNFLKCYYDAYNSLNKEEQKIFNATFIDRFTDLEIIDKYKTHSAYVRTIRKSAIVRFSLKAGLNKFVNQI